MLPENHRSEKPKSSAEKAKRLIKRHLSTSARSIFFKDIMLDLIFIVFTPILFAFVIFPPFEIHSDWPILTYHIPLGAVAIIVLIIAIFQFICTFQHFRAIRTAESAWTEYAHLLTATPDQLHTLFYDAETMLNSHTYNISALRKEQERLRKECEAKIADLNSQIQTEEKLIALDDLDEKIAIIRQVASTLYNITYD